MKKLFKTIKSWFVPDENGRTNQVAIILFFGALGLPFVIFEGIKLGLYDQYTINMSGLEVIVSGLTVPFFTVLQMKNNVAFGSGYGKGFAWDYLIIFMFCYVAIVAMSFIVADRNKNKSNKKDGWTEFQNIDKFNKAFAYPKGAEIPEETPEGDREGEYEPGNMILSDRVRYDLEPKGTNTYSCALICGATGSGKSFTYVKPNILQMNSSYVVTDPKGELTRDTGKALLDHGYDVRLFNVSEPAYSCKYNPFKYIRDEAGVVTMVNVFLDNTNDPNASSGNDPFFGLAEKNFYLAIFFYIYTVYKDQPEKQTFKTVYEMYQAADEPDTKPGQAAPENEFDKAFRELAERDRNNPALGYYATFKKGSPKTKQSILISAGVRLWFMSVGEIANLLSGDDLHLETMGDRKSALFVIIPTENKTYNFLSAMLFTQLFETLYHVGNTLNEKSWLLVKGNCVALRSKPFILGTDSQNQTLQELKERQLLYQSATIEDDNELMKHDRKLMEKFTKPNEHGIIPWPKVRLVAEKDGKRIVLEEFNSRRAAEIVKDAAINGTIKQGSKSLTCHVRFILDEFFNIGKIPDFDMKLATFRSLRISADIIVQSIAQLKEMYEDRHGKITSNCSITILLGANDLDDCKWFSDLIGQTTVRSESINIDNKGVIQGSSGGSISDNAQMLLRPEQIRSMDKDQCLILVNTCNPIRDKKYVSLNHPRWKESFSDKDPKLAKNEFQYRRLFFIEQNDENRVSAAGALTLNKPAVPASQVGQPQIPQKPRINANSIGIDQLRTAQETYNNYRMQKEQKAMGPKTLDERLRSTYAEVINENDEIKVRNLKIDARARLIQGMKSGDIVAEDGKIVPARESKSKADLMDDL